MPRHSAASSGLGERVNCLVSQQLRGRETIIRTGWPLVRLALYSHGAVSRPINFEELYCVALQVLASECPSEYASSARKNYMDKLAAGTAVRSENCGGS